jgi:hypothetical protein
MINSHTAAAENQFAPDVLLRGQFEGAAFPAN